MLEGIMLGEKRRRYPKCVDGARACPPEDCGGPHGYYLFLQIIADPDNEEYEEMLAWVGGNFEPEHFAPERVKFDNPSERWTLAFSNEL